MNLIHHIKQAAFANPAAYADTVYPVSSAVLHDAQRFVAIIQGLISDPHYQQLALADLPPQALVDQQVLSVFSCCDFHVTGDGIKLIELNTHSGGGIATAVWQQVLTETQPHHYLFNDYRSVLDSFWSALENEWRRWPGAKGRPLQKIAIVDDQPQAQAYFPEFEIAQHQLRERGYQVDIVNADGLTHLEADLIYNRCVDFYFTEPRHDYLRQLLLNDQACFSCNPRVHALTARKSVLVILTEIVEGLHPEIHCTAEDRSFLARIVPKTYLLKSLDLEAVWQQRKAWVFKPREGYRAKGVYRGKTISRSYFDRLDTEHYIVQEFVPAPQTEQGLKAELRFYHYGDHIQYGLARLYKGQVTNFQDPTGGAAPLVLVD